MDRNIFLKKCQAFSALEHTSASDSCTVTFDGAKYFPYAYEMRFDKGQPIDRAVLHDPNGNTTVYARLTDVQ